MKYDTLQLMHKWFVRLALGVMTLGVLAPSAFAATPPPPAGSPGQGLEISPPVIELNANPGQTVTANIRVRNVTRVELIAKGRADDFGAGNDESGQPKLLLDETGATRFSLKYWVGSVPDLRLAPQELKTSTISIRVPTNAEPGGHFGVIRFTAIPPDLDGTGVALSASVGTLVLLKVAGQVTDKLSLSEFSVWQQAKKRNFFEHGPLEFLIRVKNEGSVHEKPTGTITLTNMLGKKTAEIKVNPSGGNVLPDSIRRYTSDFEQKQLFGRYTAKLAITYAADKKLDKQITFWVIPWKLILLLLVGLAVLGWLLKLAIRRYNDHIIAQARRRR